MSPREELWFLQLVLPLRNIENENRNRIMKTVKRSIGLTRENLFLVLLRNVNPKQILPALLLVNHCRSVSLSTMRFPQLCQRRILEQRVQMLRGKMRYQFVSYLCEYFCVHLFYVFSRKY